MDGIDGEWAEPTFLAGDGGDEGVGVKDVGVAFDFAGGCGEDVSGAVIGLDEIRWGAGPEVEVAHEIR